jgi:hypothetical protein
MKLYLYIVKDSAGKHHEITAHDNHINEGYVVFVYHELKSIMFYRPISVIISSVVDCDISEIIKGSGKS